MTNKKFKTDERIVRMTNKIISETYFVVVLLLIISVLIKTYIMRAPYTDYITELGIIIVSTIYISVRSMLAGNPLMDTSKRNRVLTIVIALGLSLIITVVNGVKNYLNYGEKYAGLFDLHYLVALVVIFISSFALISVMLLFIYVCHRGGERKIEEELSGDNEKE